MKTGGGPLDVQIVDDPELDSLGINIELHDSVDSDTLAMARGTRTSYNVVDGILVPFAVNNENEAMDEDDSAFISQALSVDSEMFPSQSVRASVSVSASSSRAEAPSIPAPRSAAVIPSIPASRSASMENQPNIASEQGRNKGGARKREETIKVQRNQQFMVHEGELHDLKLNESRLRILLVEKELEMKTKEMEQAEELFHLKKKIMLLEKQLLSKKGEAPTVELTKKSVFFYIRCFGRRFCIEKNDC